MASIPQQTKLPFIDFSNGRHKLSPEDPEWAALRTEVRRAAEEFGCFEARFDGVPPDLQKIMIGSLPELFNLPLETKLQNFSSKAFHGYLGQFPAMPLYESLGIDYSDQHEKVEEAVRALWPQGHPTFSETVQSYSDNLSTLDRIVRRMILESLGLEKYIEEHLSTTYYLLRVMKYKEPQTPVKKLGVHEHTDRNTMTILHQNQIDGLEIQRKDGEWMSLQPSQESFVVVIGDSLYAWTNGRVHSANHRVMLSGSQVRYSVGLFSVPKAGYIVKAPDELVDAEHPLLFKPFDYAEFLKFYWTEYVKGAESSLKAYCGAL